MEKMKKTHIIMPLVFFVVLLFLQFSCSTTKKIHDEKVTDKIAETNESMLLADRHKESGIECNDCHGETQTGSRAAKEACMSCHKNYEKLGASQLDFHNAHIVSSGCDDCHHAHKPSELICQGCHIFDVQVP